MPIWEVPMQIALNTLDFSGPYVRQTPPSPRADKALRDSIAARGVLQSILVRPFGNGFQVVLGWRRARISIDLGLTDIPADCREMSDRDAIEAQLMENLQRTGMHPIDQWKATRQLLDAGATVEDAAMACGLDTRAAQRMALLAKLHPDIEALIHVDMPKPSALGAIALASPEQQAAALRVPYAAPDGQPNWVVISRACRGNTIPRGIAIFDTDKAGVVFEEDLFAEPGTPEQFVTRDTAGFIAAQTAALQARVESGRAQGQRIQYAEWQGNDIRLPPGWSRDYMDVTSNAGPNADRVIVLTAVSRGQANFGQIVEVLALPPKEASSSNGQSGPDLDRRQPAAIAARTAAASPVRGSSPGKSRKSTTVGTKPSEPSRWPSLDPKTLSPRGRSIVAKAKTAALREHLINPPGAHQDLSLLTRCLLLALAGANVTVMAQGGTKEAYDVRFDDLAALQVDPNGDLVELSGAGVFDLICEALARMLTISDQPYPFQGSGAVAEWIGRALDIPGPRLDTPEFLATLTKDQLHRICREQDPDRSMPTTVAALRRELAGRLPGWRPVEFDAPGPKLPWAADHAPSHEAEAETV
jgi:ParB/RepB/Spo0J family partition protein